MSNNPLHEEAKAEILSITFQFQNVKVSKFSASAQTSFSMQIAVPSIEIWRVIEQKLQTAGLNPEVHGGTKHHYGGEVTYRVEVHVPEEWQRPSTLHPDAARLFQS